MAQKAVEMGVSRLQPVITRHTQVARVNVERMRANAIEAAQQCGVLSIPEVAEPVPFKALFRAADADRLLIFCDEDAEVKDPVAALAAARSEPSALLPAAAADAARPMAVLIGPEGGFSEEERAALAERPNVLRLSLGPAHSARRYRGGGGAGFGAGGAGRLDLDRDSASKNFDAAAGKYAGSQRRNAVTKT